jgi:uroporphyrin-III C-methyltransferase/precorrin-2 dehydrogenase/sirohydrochlorin ferrochelatase/uroporphyrin-III C-methyltransferase
MNSNRDATSQAADGTLRFLREPGNPRPRGGVVYLVGGGPGDPELLTLRAARLIAGADAVVYDHLIGAGIVELAPAGAERHYVGKEAGNHTLPQPEINALLVRLARRGLSVVRLKGGDPFIFGRGGEEVEDLVDAGIPFEIVPGVTAASGAAAYSGIPLTHRDFAQACVFVTGHLKDGSCNLDWAMLARPHQTVVIYMGVGALKQIACKLIAHGLPPQTPAAAIRHATTTAQQVVTGTIATLAEQTRAAGVKPPALIIVGKVVQLHDRLAWFPPQLGLQRSPKTSAAS